MAAVARDHGVDANQVFAWRRQFERGGLVEPRASSTALIPVRVSGSRETADEASAPQPQAAGSGAIHIELPGRALISVESGADPVLLRAVLESLRK
ncbi:MAG: transposase [Terracidiphilus sp.]